MRVAPRDLKAVRASGIVTRYALMGDGAFVFADLPDAGTAGTPVEDACRQEHWGLVLDGELELLGRRTRTLEAGMAFYVAPGPVHRFRAAARATVAGFAPITEPPDESPDALRARGIEVLRRVGAPPPRPTSIRVVGRRTRSAASGQIATESAVMGAWLFTRSTFGRQSGYAESWCDLPHWGLVLDGNLVLHWEPGDLELLGPGDVFHCPGGPPGHRIEVPDVATIIDYTPVAALGDPARRRAPRTIAAWANRTAAPAPVAEAPGGLPESESASSDAAVTRSRARALEHGAALT